MTLEHEHVDGREDGPDAERGLCTGPDRLRGLLGERGVLRHVELLDQRQHLRVLDVEARADERRQIAQHAAGCRRREYPLARPGRPAWWFSPFGRPAPRAPDRDARSRRPRPGPERRGLGGTPRPRPCGAPRVRRRSLPDAGERAPATALRAVECDGDGATMPTSSGICGGRGDRHTARLPTACKALQDVWNALRAAVAGKETAE